MLGNSKVVLGELVLPAPPAAVSSAVPLVVFEGGLVLADAILPPSALAGETLFITFSWRSDVTAFEDYVQFLHLGHDGSGEWWVYDQQPLGARLPTRLWYNGLSDSEIWQIPLPADMAPGNYWVFTGLYRVRDGVRANVRSAAVSPTGPDSRVLLGSLMVQ